MSYPRILQRLFANDGAGPKLLGGIIPFGTTAGTACQGNDARLSNARTPTAHKTTHKTGGADALMPADIGAAAVSHSTPLATASVAGHVKPGTGASVDAAGTLSVKYGTAAGTACQGNDVRLSGGADWTASKPDLVKRVEVLEMMGPFLGEFYVFRHPTLRSGFQPAQGGLLANAATKYPDVWAYLQTTEGKKLCKTEAEWQALTKATWATLADGTKVGWNGIGGAPWYVQDLNAGTLRLPDLRGMYAEAAGFDALGVGGVHGDAMREMLGTLYYMYGADSQTPPATGVFVANKQSNEGQSVENNLSINATAAFVASRVVPVAPVNHPRAWGALACVYLGVPR